MLTQERLKELLHYDPETGVFTNVARRRHVKVGAESGSTSPRGYRIITICNKTYRAHRLAWLYMTGEWPKQRIDHINGITSDNRIANLRDVSQRENCQNRRTPRSTNKTNFLGVSKERGRLKWRARIRADGKVLQIGQYDSPEAAHEAYVLKKRELHSTCTL